MKCPECSRILDFEEDDLEEDDGIDCDECGVELYVYQVNPVVMMVKELRNVKS